MSVSVLRSDQPGDESAVKVLTWPQIPAEVSAVADLLAEHVIGEWQRRYTEARASVMAEEQLPRDVAEAVRLAMEAPRRFSLHSEQAYQLQHDERFRRMVQRVARAYASHLRPLSELLYAGRQDIEEIQILTPVRWMLRSGHARFDIAAETIPEPLTTAEGLNGFFQTKVLEGLIGVVGDSNLSATNPMIEATVGSIMRIAISRPPILGGNAGFSATLRIPSATRIRTLTQYVSDGAMSPAVAEFLSAAVHAKLNIVIAGAGGTGKTTLLRVLCALIPEEELVLTIEDSDELRLLDDRGDGGRDENGDLVPRPWHDRTIPLVTFGRPGSPDAIRERDLVRQMLRRSVDRVVLGEARGAEAADLLDAMTTGHEGSLLSIHTNSAEATVERLRDCVMKHPDYQGNDGLALQLVHRTINVVIHMKRAEPAPGDDISPRRVISGVVVLGGKGQVEPIYGYPEDPPGSRFQRLRQLGDLPSEVATRLRPYLPHGELPEA